MIRLFSALCSLFSALCSLFSALCSLFSALCSLLSVLCSLLSVLCSLLSAHCSLLSAHCSLLSAHCSLFSALCSLLTDLNHSPCFEFQVFIDTLKSEFLRRGEYTLDTMAGEFLYNKAFFEREFLSDDLIIHLLNMFRGLV